MRVYTALVVREQEKSETWKPTQLCRMPHTGLQWKLCNRPPVSKKDGGGGGGDVQSYRSYRTVSSMLGHYFPRGIAAPEATQVSQDCGSI